MNKGYIYAIVASVAWGMAYTLDQKVLERFSPTALLFVHALVTVAVTVPIFFLAPGTARGMLSATKNQWFVALASTLLIIAANWCILASIKMLGASTASVFEISYPLFVVLFSFLVFRTVVTMPFMIGALLIFLGSVIIIRFGS